MIVLRIFVAVRNKKKIGENLVELVYTIIKNESHMKKERKTSPQTNVKR